MNRLTIAAALMLGTWSLTANATAVENGSYLNTSFLNGSYLNGSYLNGSYLNTALINGGIVNGSPVGGITRFGQPVQYVGLFRSELIGYTVEWSWWWGYYWAPHSGAWFNGALINGTVINPTTHVRDVVPLRIDSFVRSAAPNDDVTTYVVSAKLDTPDQQGHMIPGWHPICGLDGQFQPIPAVPLQGTWSYEHGTFYGGSKTSASADSVTFACLNGSLGKCAAKFGYKPWPQAARWMYLCDESGHCGWTFDDLQDFHQACSRMVTDDFCGDGVSYTTTGTRIDIWDQLGINWFDWTDAWKFEAAWTPTGAQWLVCERSAPFGDTCPSYVDPAGGPVKHQMPSRACIFGGSEDPSLSLTGALLGNRSIQPWTSFTLAPPPPPI